MTGFSESYWRLCLAAGLGRGSTGAERLCRLRRGLVRRAEIDELEAEEEPRDSVDVSEITNLAESRALAASMQRMEEDCSRVPRRPSFD